MLDYPDCKHFLAREIVCVTVQYRGGVECPADCSQYIPIKIKKSGEKSMADKKNKLKAYLIGGACDGKTMEIDKDITGLRFSVEKELYIIVAENDKSAVFIHGSMCIADALLKLVESTTYDWK